MDVGILTARLSSTFVARKLKVLHTDARRYRQNGMELFRVSPRIHPTTFYITVT